MNDMKILKENFSRFLNEIEITNKNDAALVDEFSQRLLEIQELAQQLKEKTDANKKIQPRIAELLKQTEGYKIRLLETKKYILEINKNGYSRTSVPYKEVYEEALTKVNDATKKVLLELENSLTKSVNVEPSLRAHSKAKLKEVNNGNIQRYFAIVDNANKKLKAIASKLH